MASVDQSYNNPRNRKKVLSLVEIATNKCIQHVAKLEDVGATPFHLLVPVLRRMNAKQLGQIEELSPQITPDSDELWTNLVSKEFPDRPILANSIRASKVKSKRANMVVPAGRALMFCDMPMKSLYFKYSDERESFRQDSAERLRKITQRLKKEKSANSIVSVPELLRDPTVRRRRFDGGSGYSRSEASYGPKNSILNKARKEIRNRSLMFPNYAQKVKKYDPYEAFNHKDAPSVQPGPPISHSLHQPRQQPRFPQRHQLAQPSAHPAAHPAAPRYAPRFNHNRADTSQRLGRPPTIFNGQPIQHSTNAPRPIEPVPKLVLEASSYSSSPKPTSPPIHNASLSEPHSPPTSVSSSSPLPRAVSEAIRKRKAEPSIFLTGNRNKRPMRVPRAQMKGLAPNNDSNTQPPNKKITLIKSSIFN